jgi:diguanylate cyclase (GGDEF)-like protein
MIDIDHFKLYNDRYGHQQGDACLRNVASALQEAINRPRDLLARYGGEEFACLLPECDAAGALTVGRKAVETVAALKLPHDASETTDIVTISAGIAAAIPGPDATPEDLLAAADHQLYRAKLRGRNTVEGKDRISVPGESATAV